MSIQLGLIGIVGEAFKADFWAAAERVAKIGYRGIEAVEPYLVKGDPRENIKRFEGFGLKLLTVTAMRERLRDKLDEVIAECKALNCARASCWWAPCDTRESILADAELYNRVGKRLLEEGIQLCYHPHDHEFKLSHNGVRAMDVLLDHTDPSCVFFEMDVAWAAIGGQDPIELLRRTKGRVPAIHVKDVHTLAERAKWTTVGTGVVGVEACLKVAIEVGIPWAVVEQDQPRTLTGFDCITASYLNLKETGLVG
jgi:sugar phosphate isomerase/epimerase